MSVVIDSVRKGELKGYLVWNVRYCTLFAEILCSDLVMLQITFLQQFSAVCEYRMLSQAVTMLKQLQQRYILLFAC